MSGHTFCRFFLKATMEEVRKHAIAEEIKKAWTYRFLGNDTVEFHGPNKFYWVGRGHCLWHAKAQGWNAWLAKKEDEAND